MSDEIPAVTQEAVTVYEAIREINHLTLGGSTPAPIVYDVLGNLKGAAGPMLAQALSQLAAGLERSLGTHDVYDRPGRDPAQAAAAAAYQMRTAARMADEIGRCLEQAQLAINSQGYKERTGADE